MDKKRITALRKYGRIESVILIIISFSIYYLATLSDSQKFPDEKEIPLLKEESLPQYAVFFDEEIGSVQNFLALNAQRSIKAATYTYSDSSLVRLYEKKAKEGIKVKVVAGRNRDNSTPGFSFSVIEQERGIVHPKFTVVDSKDIFITSSNMSSNLSTSSNSGVLFRDVPVAAKILEEEISALFSGNIEKRCPHGCETEIGTIYFTPGSACRNVRDLFSKAENRIYGAVYTLTLRHPLITGLKHALKKDVKVNLIVDNWIGRENRKVNKGAKRYLKSLGAEVEFDNNILPADPLFHHKFAVVDGKTVIFGSMNWTASGCYRNREIIVVNNNPSIAKEFEKYFNSLF